VGEGEKTGLLSYYVQKLKAANPEPGTVLKIY
jgi:hypothetical protein